MAESVNAIEMSLRQWLSFHKMHNCSRAGRSDSIYLHGYKIELLFPCFQNWLIWSEMFVEYYCFKSFFSCLTECYVFPFDARRVCMYLQNC